MLTIFHIGVWLDKFSDARRKTERENYRNSTGISPSFGLHPKIYGYAIG